MNHKKHAERSRERMKTYASGGAVVDDGMKELVEGMEYTRRGAEHGPSRPEMNKGQGPTPQNQKNMEWERATSRSGKSRYDK